MSEIATQDVPDTASPLVIDHGDTRTVDEGQQPVAEGLSELEQHRQWKGGKGEPAKAEPEEPSAQAAKPEEKKAPERWTDPDTGDVYDMRHRAAKRLRAVLDNHGTTKAELESLRKERDELMRALTQRGEQRQETKPKETQETPNDPEPDPTDTQKYPEGQFDRAFMRDMGRWAARQETGKYSKEAETKAHEERRQAAWESEKNRFHSEVLPEAKKRYGDFESVLKQVADAIPGDRFIPDILSHSPVGCDVIYVLGTNADAMDAYKRAPSEAGRLRVLHHIEAQVIHSQRAASAKTKESKTNAPPPTDPVHTSGPAAGAIDWTADDPDQYQRWKAMRRSNR